MSEPTEEELAANREALDQAVRKFNAQNQGREGAVTGWVLMIASSRYTEDGGDVLYGYDYTFGPNTDLVRGVGLVRVATLRMEDHLVHGFPEEDD